METLVIRIEKRYMFAKELCDTYAAYFIASCIYILYVKEDLTHFI